jgi:threonine-phosphate decarboxylase
MSRNTSNPAAFTLPTHGGQLSAVAQRSGISAKQLTDFSASINPDGPPTSVLSALRQALSDPATLTNYPDLEHTALKQAISRHAAIPEDCISIANGFVPLLHAALHMMKIRRCLLPVPAFSEYRHSLEQAGVAITPYPLEPSGFCYSPGAMLRTLPAAHDQSYDAILLANPQNPSGILTPRAVMLELVQAAATHGMTVLLDEAFIDYTHAESLVLQACMQSNLIVFRSVTKFFSIPGLRVAYAVSHPEQAREFARSLSPWPVTTLASLAVVAALKDSAYAERSRQGNRLRRGTLQRQLELLGIIVYPSQANFLLLKLPPAENAQRLGERMIREEHIVVRACEDFEALSSHHLRVAVRSEQENAHLVQALQRLLGAH